MKYHFSFFIFHFSFRYLVAFLSHINHAVFNTSLSKTIAARVLDSTYKMMNYSEGAL
jgi:hypothetical protein